MAVSALQRLSALLPSTAPVEEKMKAATLLADSLTSKLCANVNKQEQKAKLSLSLHLCLERFTCLCNAWLHVRPKALNAIKEDRLAARQELKAICNILDYAGAKLDAVFPEYPFLPLNPATEMRSSCNINGETWSFITNKTTQQSRWDVPLETNTQHLRLVLSPDEGSPLYSAWQFVCHHWGAVGFNRDESCLSYNICLCSRPGGSLKTKAQAPCILRTGHLMLGLCETHLGKDKHEG